MTASTTALPPNHHADLPGFSGVTGLLAALTMVIGRGSVSRLAADLSEVTATDHVVDVGCGPGASVRLAAKRGARVTGVDPAPVMLKMAGALTRDPTITWTEGAAEALPLPDASATVLWSIASVHHWPDLEGGLAEAHRVLAPGGRLVVVERRTKPDAKGLASHGWTKQQAEDFAGYCRRAGFSDVNVATHRPGRLLHLAVTAIRS